MEEPMEFSLLSRLRDSDFLVDMNHMDSIIGASEHPSWPGANTDKDEVFAIATSRDMNIRGCPSTWFQVSREMRVGQARDTTFIIMVGDVRDISLPGTT